MQVGEGFDEAKRLGLGFEYFVARTPRNDQDIKFLEPLESLFEVDVGSEGATLFGNGVLFCGREGAFEGFRG